MRKYLSSSLLNFFRDNQKILVKKKQISFKKAEALMQTFVIFWNQLLLKFHLQMK